MTYKILIVDDEPSNLRALQRLLGRTYTVVTAGGGREALGLILQHDFAAIISDQRMPGMTGIEFLKQAAHLRPQTVRLLLTGYTDVETLVDAINSGAIYHYLTKPWDNDDLLRTVRRALQHHESIKETHRAKSDLERVGRRLDVMHSGILRLCGEVLRLKDPSLPPHAERTSEYARTLARMFELPAAASGVAAAAARMLPLTYGPSTTAEVIAGGAVNDDELVRRTAELTCELDIFEGLLEIEEFREIAETIRFVNEHYDGSGYPDRLAGDRIPLASRIVAAARAYDLVTAVGVHGRRLTHQQALEYLAAGAPERFDPRVIDAMRGYGFVSRVARFAGEGGREPLPSLVPTTAAAPPPPALLGGR